MKFKKCVLCIILMFFSFSGIHAREFHNAPSFQGYTGLLNIPNAYVTEQGKFYGLFNNQIEYHRRKGRDSAENYMLSFGLLPYSEFGARLTEEHPEGIRDLSASAKFQIPYKLFFKNQYLPDIALGIADMGGGSTHFQTRYGVISQDIKLLRLSLGYGNGPDRMDGVFGGAELRLFDWFYLLGEYDTKEKNLGLRFVTPDDLLNLPVNFGFTAKTSLDHEPGDFDIAFSFQIPLGWERNNTQPLKKHAANDRNFLSQESSAMDLYKKDQISQQDSIQTTNIPDSFEVNLLRVKEKLADLGFENLKVGTKKDTILYIEYENNRYNHNELDGLGLVLGVAATQAPSKFKSLIVIIKQTNVPMLEIKSSIYAYKDFLNKPKKFIHNNADFFKQLKINSNISSDEDISLVGGDDNLSQFRTRLFIYPGLKTLIGTEFGVFDYLLSVKPDAQMDLWKGGILNARFDIPVLWSNDFEDDKDDAQLDRFMLHQSFKINPDIMTMFSVGMYDNDNTGLLNETIWTPGDGKHRFKLKLGYFDDNEIDSSRKIYLGSYRYYYDNLDLFFEGTYGKYWHQDRGLYLEMKRFFGDTAIGLFYRHVGSETGERAAGLRVSLPLTPRRDMKPSYVQLRGADQWSYAHQTTIASSGEKNPINTNIAIIPKTSHNLERNYYNRDRLNERYIKRHLLRLRDAYIKWGNLE